MRTTFVGAICFLLVSGNVATANDKAPVRPKKEHSMTSAERATRKRLDQKAAAPAGTGFNSICIGCESK